MRSTTTSRHTQLERHAQQHAFRFNTRDVNILRGALNLWVQFCMSAITSILTICGLLISVRCVQEGVQRVFHYTIEAKYNLCRLLNSKDLQDLQPVFVNEEWQDAFQAQTRCIMAPFMDTYAETLRAYLEEKGILEEEEGTGDRAGSRDQT